MYHFLAYILILMMTGCSALENLSKNDDSNRYKKNESEILDEDFFSSGMFVFSETNENVQNSEEIVKNNENNENNESKKTKEETLDEYRLNPKSKGKVDIASHNYIEHIEPTEYIDKEYVQYLDFSANSSDSLKVKLHDFLNQNGYKLIWDTSYDVSFENSVQYEGDDILNILKSIANDLSKMGIDIHLNVYLKNKVVLVYSVRS